VKKKREGISQQGIARDLGISQALVSLVLNGKRENISEDSYRRIWEHAVKIGYRPKGMQPQGGHLTATNVGIILRAGLRLAKELTPLDRALCHELVMGVLRRQLWLDRLIEYYADRKLADLDVAIDRRKCCSQPGPGDIDVRSRTGRIGRRLYGRQRGAAAQFTPRTFGRKHVYRCRGGSINRVHAAAELSPTPVWAL